MDDSLAKLGRRFRQFVEAESVWSSPLYTRLSLGVADDPAVLALAAEATARPIPNLLFGAVHYLLLRDPDQPLAAFYPSLTPQPDTTGDPYPAFHAFCLAQRDAIHDLLTTRLVQTNEVRRCALFLPAFARAARQAPNRPLALVEIGPSAGLNLLWDRYGYDYGPDGRVGDAASPVQLRCMLQGERRPAIPATLPAVAYRTGIDLHPVDVRDPDAVLWLRALIWPEHADRRALLEQAVALAQPDPPPLIAGDALARLPEALAAVPPGTTLCVFHSFTLNQFSPQGRAQVAAILAAESARRDLYHLWIEQQVADYPDLGFAVLHAGAADARILARCNAHGQWLEWLCDN